MFIGKGYKCVENFNRALSKETPYREKRNQAQEGSDEFRNGYQPD